MILVNITYGHCKHEEEELKVAKEDSDVKLHKDFEIFPKPLLHLQTLSSHKKKEQNVPHSGIFLNQGKRDVNKPVFRRI